MSKSLTAGVLDGKRAPINGIAARVLQHGQHWRDGAAPEGSRDSANPLPTYPVAEWQRVSPKMVNLTGRKVGFLTVLGFGGNKRWVARCVCGTYTLRTAKALTNPANTEDACDRCNAKHRMAWQQKNRSAER